MEQALSIWSPVVVAELNTPHWCESEQTYSVNQLFRVLEDLKIKVKKSEAYKQGQAVEVRVKTAILCLLQDQNGKAHLVKKEDTIKERIGFEDFNRGLSKDDEINFIINIRAINGNGDLSGGVIRVKYYIEYNLIATREQIVQVWTGEREVNNESINRLLQKLQDKINHLTGENQELSRKVFFYQRDISSLKRSIAKLEKQNTMLLKDLNFYQQENEGLRQSLQEKDEHIYRLLNNGIKGNENIPKDLTVEGNDDISLGRRIKRLFLNNIL